MVRYKAIKKREKKIKKVWNFERVPALRLPKANAERTLHYNKKILKEGNKNSNDGQKNVYRAEFDGVRIVEYRRSDAKRRGKVYGRRMERNGR